MKNELKRVIERTRDLSSFAYFQRWLKRNGPFDVIVDGLNVGFAKTGQFIPSNIVKMVRHLESLGHRVGVMAKNHTLRFDSIQPLHQKGQLFCVSENRLDDLYWIYAAVHGKLDVMCLTNDKMRDHDQYLDPSKVHLFARWKLGHRLEFDFVGRDLIPTVKPPRTFYTISQHLPTRETTPERWHVPCETTGKWLCLTKTQATIPPPPPPSASTPEPPSLPEQQQQEQQELQQQ